MLWCKKFDLDKNKWTVTVFYLKKKKMFFCKLYYSFLWRIFCCITVYRKHTTLLQRCGMVAVVMLIANRQNYVVLTLPQRRTVSLIHSVLWILYWQSCCNVEIATLNSQRFHKVDTTTSNYKVVPTLPQRWIKNSPHIISQHIMDVVMATSIQHCNRNVKFTTFSQCWY